MDKRHLDTLIAAVRTGSFSKASEELHCTQSAVTQSINALENELNCKLLIRSHKGIVLSETGELLYPFVLEAEKSLALLQKQAIRLSAKKKGFQHCQHMAAKNDPALSGNSCRC